MESTHTVQHRYGGYNIDLWPEDGDDFDYVGCYRIAYGGAAVHLGRVAGLNDRPSALDAAWRAATLHIDSIAAVA